jgi:hypothetical protein
MGRTPDGPAHGAAVASSAADEPQVHPKKDAMATDTLAG